MSDPIRARLDRLITPLTSQYDAIDYRAALRAVLDECDDAKDRTVGARLLAEYIRRVIAESLGVTDG